MTVKQSLWELTKEETAGELAFIDLPDFEEKGSTCFFVTGETLGRGLDSVGARLMEDLFVAMVNQRYYPQVIILTNSGVKLLARDHALGSVFRELETNGTAVFASVRSVALYGLEDQIEKKFLADTSRILELLRNAQKVITI